MRLSVGIEDAGDIIADLDRAFAMCKEEHRL
jgi:cystathionine beta-lyase/cystathionine gamma-synthase